MKTEQKLYLKNYKELSNEIDKRNYKNIEGLKAPITEEEFYYFLNVRQLQKHHRY